VPVGLWVVETLLWPLCPWAVVSPDGIDTGRMRTLRERHKPGRTFRSWWLSTLYSAPMFRSCSEGGDSDECVGCGHGR